MTKTSSQQDMTSSPKCVIFSLLSPFAGDDVSGCYLVYI